MSDTRDDLGLPLVIALLVGILVFVLTTGWVVVTFSYDLWFTDNATQRWQFRAVLIFIGVMSLVPPIYAAFKKIARR